MMPPPLSTLAAFDARRRRIGSLAASVREPRPRTEETRRTEEERAEAVLPLRATTAAVTQRTSRELERAVKYSAIAGRLRI